MFICRLAFDVGKKDEEKMRVSPIYRKIKIKKMYVFSMFHKCEAKTSMDITSLRHKKKMKVEVPFILVIAKWLLGFINCRQYVEV